MHYRRSSAARVRQQRGAALIVAMLVFALATALVVAMKGDFDRFYQRTANQILDEQAQASLRAAEELAAMALITDYDQDKAKQLPRDDLSEIWSPDPRNPPPTNSFEDIGMVSGTVKDLAGRFNLNLLATRVQPGAPGATTERFSAAQKQFIRLLQAVGEPEVSQEQAIVITEAVSDWLDSDEIPLQDGAEDEYYSSRTPAYRTANRAMASVSELRAVAHMTPALYERLRFFVTVWPAQSGKLNIHTADKMVLRSINADDDLSPLSDAEAESLVEYRGDIAQPMESHFKDVPDFLIQPVFTGKTTTGIKDLLDTKSSYFLLEAEAEVAGRNMRLYSVLHRGNRRIDAIARASGSL